MAIYRAVLTSLPSISAVSWNITFDESIYGAGFNASFMPAQDDILAIKVVLDGRTLPSSRTIIFNNDANKQFTLDMGIGRGSRHRMSDIAVGSDGVLYFHFWDDPKSTGYNGKGRFHLMSALAAHAVSAEGHKLTSENFSGARRIYLNTGPGVSYLRLRPGFYTRVSFQSRVNLIDAGMFKQSNNWSYDQAPYNYSVTDMQQGGSFFILNSAEGNLNTPQQETPPSDAPEFPSANHFPATNIVKLPDNPAAAGWYLLNEIPTRRVDWMWIG